MLMNKYAKFELVILKLVEEKREKHFNVFTEINLVKGFILLKRHVSRIPQSTITES